ncbi:tail fiber domain-containing protein [Actinomadura sp. DC4]|uniref:tail fiber domain-containing protein n=1 Tax=Actinomadura sp. DC4 TaxID=3055069 RepID=UPI0025B0CD03|nr:tail fiber domain-containing protein [Actinomadura sp. DC4]MDN3354888.1 tail fiber domain-containing protein [Actinomadura sp. DC4]
MVSRNRNLDKRANWFDRQFIRAQDLVDADDYAIDRHRRHVRTMHTPGVAEGLTVGGEVGAKSVTVDAGTAVDAIGREIVALTSMPAVTLPEDVSNAEIYLLYEEAFDDPSTDPGVSGFTRIREIPSLAVRRLGDDGDPVPASAGDRPVPGILLAAVSLDGGALTVVPDNSVRTAAGSVIGVAAFDKVLLRRSGHPESGYPGIGADPGTGDILFTAGSPPAERMRISATGRVGIGTSGPLPGALTVEHPQVPLVLRQTGAPASGGVWRASVQNSTLKWEANTAAAGDFSTAKTMVTMSPGEDTVTLGSGYNVALRTRHVNGKSAGDDSPDVLILNWNNDKMVQIGSDGHETLVKTHGEVMARNFPADDQTQALAALSLASRGRNGIEFTWKTYTAPIGGGHGVQPNAYEIWSYDQRGGLPRAAIHADGNTYVCMSGGQLYVGNALVTTSDVRLKSDVTTVAGAMDRLAGLRGVSYLPRTDPDRRRLGVVAQEVQETCPELVFTSGRDDYLGVDYQGITAVLVEAVKELAAEVEDLRGRLSEGRNA